MPIIRSAKKKLRQDKKKQVINAKYEKNYKNAIKKAKKSKSDKDIKKAQSEIGKAAKRGVIHKKRAARLKSQVARLLKKAKK